VPDAAKLLRIYLNDHLAGATAGRELSKRALDANRDTEFGGFLERLHEEIVEDRETLLSVMRRLGYGPDHAKVAGAIAAERAGRLKLNGALRSYSPLSRLVEHEGLIIGVDAKRSLWNVLDELQSEQLCDFNFAALAGRAQRQHDELEAHKQQAARVAFG